MDALRMFTQVRVACSNSVEELDSLNSMTSRWDQQVSTQEVEAAALDLQIHCESAAKEATAIHDVLTGFATTGYSPPWLWMELEVRQENAESASKQIVRTIKELAETIPDSQLALKEMKRRAHRILSKVEGLKGLIQELQLHGNRAGEEISQGS